MSETHLPDDVSRWPEDLYALLGISEAADRRELRRAYTRLIRKFKPEHFPEQFRRIRDAYEKLDGFFQYREQFGLQTSTSNDESAITDEYEKGNAADQPTDAAKDTNESSEGVRMPFVDSSPTIFPSEMPNVRPQAIREDAATRAWRKALTGDWEPAYRELRELERSRTGNMEICVRLYWLLALSPKLDESRNRCDWLTASLKKHGLVGPPIELYAREIRGDPGEAFHSRCEGILKSNLPAIQLASFAPLRWEAASSIGKWQIIHEDLEYLRDRIMNADRLAWSRLLLSAIETLLWQTDHHASSLVRDYRKEVDAYSEEHHHLENEFFRCDSLMELVSGWKKLGFPASFPREIPPLLRDILREGWLRPFGSVRPKLMGFWQPLVANPRQALVGLDKLFQLSPPIVHHLLFQVDAIYRQQHDFSIPRDREEVLAALRTFYHQYSSTDYRSVRCWAMFFCIRHQISVRDFLELSWSLLGEAQFQNSYLAASLHNDGPLHCLTLACLAYWS